MAPSTDALRPYRTAVYDNRRWQRFTPRPDDIFVCTPPKCGTTWTQTIVNSLIFQDGNSPGPVMTVSPWLDAEFNPIDELMARLDAQTHRRSIKTHTPADGIPWFDDADAFPNGAMPLAIGPCLTYAIYHSPLGFIRALLERGADPNPPAHDGFPPLIAALSCSRARPGAPARGDVPEILALLLAFGADPNQRGINDYTALHMAVAERNCAALEQLLAAGADPGLRTRIDALETPRELAEAAGLAEIAQLLAAREARREP